MANMHPLTPEFRQAQLRDRIEGLKASILARLESEILEAYAQGFDDGQCYESEGLIKRLKEFEKDSMVAKLLREIMENDRRL